MASFRGLAAAVALAGGASPARAATASPSDPSAFPSAPAATPAERSSDGYGGPPLLVSGGKRHQFGGYGSIGGGYTRFVGRDSGLVALEGAFSFDHRLSLGLAGYAFTRTPRGPAGLDGTAQQFGAGYGGLALRYSVFGNLPVYGTFGLVLGAGAVNLHHAQSWTNDSTWDDYDQQNDDWGPARFDAFLFAQPEVAMNVNVTRWLRLGANVGYRFTGGVRRFGLDNSDVNGVVASACIQLGWF